MEAHHPEHPLTSEDTTVGSPIQLQIYGHHLDLTEGLKEHIRQKLSKIEHLVVGTPCDVSITLDHQKLTHRCAITLRDPHFHVHVVASTTDMYASIDEAVKRLETKMQRYKDRMQQWHHRGGAERTLPETTASPQDSEIAEINAEISALAWKELRESVHHPVVERTPVRLKHLSLQDAVMKMDLSGDSFMVYHAEEDHRLRVIYRRPDGNYGVLDIQS